MKYILLFKTARDSRSTGGRSSAAVMQRIALCCSALQCVAVCDEFVKLI